MYVLRIEYLSECTGSNSRTSCIAWIALCLDVVAASYLLARPLGALADDEVVGIRVAPQIEVSLELSYAIGRGRSEYRFLVE
jgi:hypothetical protein